MTLDRLGIDIIQPVFSRGQLYTALVQTSTRFSAFATNQERQ